VLNRLLQTRRSDPRRYQIAVLLSLLLWGQLALGFSLAPGLVALTVTTCVVTQWVCTRAFALPRFDPRSALISSLSLCLLLRSQSEAVIVVAAVLTIASKFLLRANDKHIFNPTTFGIAVVVLAGAPAWVSPGQWGSGVIFAAMLCCAGLAVAWRSERSDVTLAFLVVYAALVFGRALWLHDPLAIPVRHLQSGALVLFAFFMISDPKTTPDHRVGRILFASAVAVGAAFVHFGLYRPNGFILSLFFLSPLVPLLDRALPAHKYRWASDPNAWRPS
jgi:Na+-transporting NADH:ubiquinone oxidoreductase subunit NqrB